MNLGVGATCVWYPHAETNQLPVACVVTAVKREGVLTLARFPQHGGTVTQIDNCHHVDDETLKENPQMRILYGAWDTVENGKRRMDGEEEAPVESEEEPSENKVYELFDQGLSLDEIAEKMGRGWGPKKVSSALKNRKTQTA